MSSRAAFGFCLALCATCLAPSARGESTTLTASDQGTTAGTVPVPLPFPIARSGDTAYPLVVSYHTIDGTAIADLDYQPVSGAAYFAPAATNANVPVTILPVPFGPPLAFQFRFDGAVGLGPDPSFSATQGFGLPGGFGATAVVAGDLNGDGLPDIVVPDSDSGLVQVLLNTAAPGAAAASFATTVTFPADGARKVAITDINGDGRPDLVVARSGFSKMAVLRNTTVLPNPTTPSFAAEESFSVGANPVSIAIADFNGDGRPDVATANSSDATVSVLLNTTAPGATTMGFASPATLQLSGSLFEIATGDVNGDGKPDLAVSSPTGGTVSVLLNDTVLPTSTTPTFAAAQDFPGGPGLPAGVALADVDNDGRLDLVVGNDDNGASEAVAVLLNTTAPGSATAGFKAPDSFDIGVSTARVTTADLNGDGKLDVIAPGSVFAQSWVLMNQTGFGALRPRFVLLDGGFGTGSTGNATAVADLNSDGRPDLVTSNGGGSLSVVLNTTAPLGLTSPQFATQKPFATPQFSRSIAPADYNGDGRADLAVSTAAAAGKVAVLLNTSLPCADPSFTAQQSFDVGNTAQSLVAADFNGDGRPDLATSNFSGATASVLFNTTAAGASVPGFTAQQTFATGAAGTLPQGVAAGDVNGDGKPDLVVASFVPGTMVIPPSSTVSVLLNTASPGDAAPSFAAFQPFPLATGVNADAITVLEVNGDGRPDVAVADYNAPGIKVFLNATAPGSSTVAFESGAPQSFAGLAGTSTFAITSADMNLDGRADVLVTNYPNGGTGTTRSVSVFLNTTAPGATTSSFAAQQNFQTGEYPFSVAASDFDGDGRPDVVVGNYFDSNLSVFLNTTPIGASTPTLTAQQVFASGSQPYAVAAADWNGDGKPDIAVANASGFSTSVLLNAQYLCKFAGNPATGTITHDGVFRDGFE